MRKTLNDENIRIGGHLRRLRLEAGLSLQDLANHLNVSHQQIQKYELGQNRLPLQVMPVLCDVLGVPVEMFLDGVSGKAGRQFRHDFQDLGQAMRRADPVLRHKIVQIVEILVA